jgi:hypothetical protein
MDLLQTLRQLGIGEEDMPGALSVLARQAYEKFQKTGDVSDIHIAVEAAQLGLTVIPDTSSYLAGHLNNLGVFLEGRYERTGEVADLEEASLTLQDAWHCQSAILFHRIQAGARCLKLLAPQHKAVAAIDPEKSIIDLLSSVSTKLFDRADQQFVVSTFSGVAADLCAFLLQSNQPADALRYLEKGRAVIIGQLMDSRSDLSLLERQHPDLACRYQ